METETVAARNVAELLLQDVFKSSICPANPVVTEPAPSKDAYVHGFDCPSAPSTDNVVRDEV